MWKCLEPTHGFCFMHTWSCFLKVLDDVDGLRQDMAVLSKRGDGAKGLDLSVFLRFL